MKAKTNLEEEKIRLEMELKRINDQMEDACRMVFPRMITIREAARETDDHIRGLKQLISDLQRISGGTLRNTPSSGFGRPTEARAIKLVECEEALTSADLDRMCLLQRLEEEKAGCPDELVSIADGYIDPGVTIVDNTVSGEDAKALYSYKDAWKVCLQWQKG